MGKYAVELKPSARKELERLPGKLIERMFPKLEALGLEPRPVRCKKLKGGQQEWRIRVEDYRVVYTVDDVKLRVSVTQSGIGARFTTGDRPQTAHFEGSGLGCFI